VPDLEIPKRALFKASEVCEIASVQPYVLRSWESEFPDLGVSKGQGAPRVYRRSDLERVLRIKQLVFSDGLTLAGVRRRIDEEAPARLPLVGDPEKSPAKEPVARHARERLAEIRNGLRAILDMLSTRPSQGQVVPFSRPGPRPAIRGKAPARRAKTAARSAAKSRRSRR
jgi:DNA-binding transcriptional MerR regulator